MQATKKKVLITGITGYIGSHCAIPFLHDDNFIVRGAVRDPKNETKLAPLRKAFGEDFYKIEFVEFDLLDEAKISKAVEGCDYVVHVASPIPAKPPKNEDDLIRPAVEGTLSVLRASQQHKVKRVVVTSGLLAIFRRSVQNMKSMYDDTDWSDVEVTHGYEKSKLLAEQAAWNYHDSLSKANRFELVTVLPGWVLGPTLVNGEFSSGEGFKMIMMGKFPSMPQIQIPIVDVRDVATAHYQAIKVEAAKDKRFICTGNIVWFREVALHLHKHYGKFYKIKTANMSLCTMKCIACFVPPMKGLIPVWRRELGLDNSKSVQILGMKYMDLDQFLVDMAESMIQLGLI